MGEIAALFSMVFDKHEIDRGNLHDQERWFALVDRAIDEGIADPDCKLVWPKEKSQ